MQNTVKFLEKPIANKSPIFTPKETLKKELCHRERVLRYATARMQEAIARMGDTRLANYVICKYFHNMKNSDIAEVFNYSERQIYRISSDAKPRLYRELVKLMPKPRRGEVGRRYRYAAQKVFLKMRAV
jgi:hypothetical protein